jgi:hypothetical protein
MLKVQKRRGRKGKGLAAEHRIIDIVYLVRYGLKAGEAFSAHPAGPLTISVGAPGFPNSQGDLTRRPGTVDGYRWVGNRAVKEVPDCIDKKPCSINRACQFAEVSFALRTPRRAQSTRLEADGSFTETELELPPHIAKRKSDGVAPEGSATRKWLDRALRKERDLFAKRGFEWSRIEWIRKKDKLDERKKKKH